MKSKLMLFLVIQISCAIDEGKDKLSDSGKKSYAYALKKGLDQNKDSIWPKKKESDGDDTSSESINGNVMSESVPIESSPNKFNGLRNVNSQNDNSQTGTGSKEIEPIESVSDENTPVESAPDELDGSHNFISQDNNSSGGSQLPDSQEVLGLKNLINKNEQAKTAEDVNPEKQNVIDSSEENESKTPFTNRDKEAGDIKPETSLIDSNTKIDNVDDNSTESDTTMQGGESSNDNRELEEQDREVESLNNTKDVSSEISKTPLISAEKNKVNLENKDISKDSSTKSSNKEDNAFIEGEASGSSGESSLDLKNEASSAIINDNQNSINDKDKSTVIQFTSEDKITPTPFSDIEGTSIDKDTGNLDETPLNFVPETIPLSNEHKEANDVEKDVSDASQSPSKIEIGKATPPIIKDAEANIKDKGSKTVNENLLNINSAEDEEHIINVNDTGHSFPEDASGKSTTLGSSTNSTETNINVNGHSSSKIGKFSTLNSSTTATGDVNNHKEASIEDHSPSEIENSLNFNSNKDEEHFINDKEVSTAGHSSSLGAATEAVTTPISSTVTKDTNNEDSFKERNSSDKVKDDPLGILERNIANSVKDLNSLSESQSNSLTEGSTSKSVNKNDNSIIQSVNDLNKNINTEFIEVEGINVTGGTTSDEPSGIDKTTEDKLNFIKNVTTEFIEEEGSNHNKAISPESDNKIESINSFDNSNNLKGTENLISKNKDNNTPSPNIHNPDSKIKENNTGRNEDDDKNPFDTRNENVTVGSVDIMKLSRDKPSISTCNNDIILDQNINNVGTVSVKGDGHEDKNNSNYDLEDSSYLESSNFLEGSTLGTIGEDSISTNIEEGSTLGTIGEDSTLGLIGESSILGTNGESSSLSNNEDTYDLNINDQNGALFGIDLNTLNNRPQTNRTPPILLKFTVSRI